MPAQQATSSLPSTNSARTPSNQSWTLTCSVPTIRSKPPSPNSSNQQRTPKLPVNPLSHLSLPLLLPLSIYYKTSTALRIDPHIKIFPASPSPLGGRIIFISATMHYTGAPLQTHVVVAKAGVDALSANVALEFGPRGITSNVIAPGPIGGTEGMERLARKEDIEGMGRRIPSGRWGTVREIADATVYLFSEAAGYVNGTVLVGESFLRLSLLGFQFIIFFKSGRCSSPPIVILFRIPSIDVFGLAGLVPILPGVTHPRTPYYSPTTLLTPPSRRRSLAHHVHEPRFRLPVPRLPARRRRRLGGQRDEEIEDLTVHLSGETVVRMRTLRLSKRGTYGLCTQGNALWIYGLNAPRGDSCQRGDMH